MVGLKVVGDMVGDLVGLKVEGSMVGDLVVGTFVEGNEVVGTDVDGLKEGTTVVVKEGSIDGEVGNAVLGIWFGETFDSRDGG